MSDVAWGRPAEVWSLPKNRLGHAPLLRPRAPCGGRVERSGSRRPRQCSNLQADTRRFQLGLQCRFRCCPLPVSLTRLEDAQ
jgi:hypothetical protein